MEEIEHTLPIEQLLETLGVGKITTGLTDAVLMNRLEKDGYNLPAKDNLKASVLVILHENLTFILYCFIMTSVLIELSDKGPSCSLSHMTIMLFTFIAHLITIFTTENPKNPKIGTLTAVIRNGKSNIVDSKFLVRGDIVEIEQSMVAPADIRIIKASNLLVNGSLLLGKDGIRMADAVGGGDYLLSSNMIFQGFTIETGKGIGVVLKTGPRTMLSNSFIRSSALSNFEFKWIIFVLVIWASAVIWKIYVRVETWHLSYMVLCLVLTKFPNFIMKGRSISLLTTSQLMISHEIYPKTIKSSSQLRKTKYLIYDIRDSLITTRKEIKNIYISDKLQNIAHLSGSEDFKYLITLLNYTIYKEKTYEAPDEPVALEDWDPRPKEKEYEHPIEVVLRDLLSNYGLAKPEYDEHYKIPLTSRNRNSLLVLTPKNKNPLAILLGDALDVMKSSKFMYVNGKNVELPSRTLVSMCEEFALEGHISVALAFSELDPSVIKSGKELSPEVFDFSLFGIFIIKEHTEDASEALGLLQELNITSIGVGRENKDYLLNLCYTSNLITEPPKIYNSEPENLWDKVLLTPLQAVKNCKELANKHSFVPNISIFDTAFLINQMKNQDICYLGNNHVALQVSDVGVSYHASSKEVKETSNFVALSGKPLVDLLKTIKALREFGDHDYFFMQECYGVLIPAIVYFIIAVYYGSETSSLGILLVDFSIPLTNQFMWIGFPRKGYNNPLLIWLACTSAGLYNYFSLQSSGSSWFQCNFAYFVTVFTCCFIKISWLHLWNFRKAKVPWGFVYGFAGIKLALFYIFCLIRFIAIRNQLEQAPLSDLTPGLGFFLVTLLLLSFIRSY
ncbi:hypothetical protein SteCoe_7716 [Stentor coeruleus]|uniref:P-type ATPase A domain-containing protein n=1 Tax=Stentor coeruleus TaxID=5963 RepID=A0A1R2CLZ6_9CILI|nr:hypothetical protein SteCoe_7716 [Stentor coeruleus]